MMNGSPSHHHTPSKRHTQDELWDLNKPLGEWIDPGKENGNWTQESHQRIQKQ